MQRIKNFIREEEAATAIEYALIAALISIAAIAAMTALGGAISDNFNAVSGNL